jgi:outer membrane protein assembly factor BamE (lipoprotein component of BamABCDE complex)
MKNLFLIFLFFFVSACNLNKVIKNHGVHFLENKHTTLSENTSNKNDIIKLLGPPSTKGNFDNDIWIYIERSTSSSKFLKLGKKTLIKNNVLVLEINTLGILEKKTFINKNDMNEITFEESFTDMSYSKKSFLFDFMYTLRKKINSNK